jgi:hypothetical protein
MITMILAAFAFLSLGVGFAYAQSDPGRFAPADLRSLMAAELLPANCGAAVSSRPPLMALQHSTLAIQHNELGG